jgi:hypothetical protein
MALSFIRGKKIGAPPKYAGSRKGERTRSAALKGETGATRKAA